MWHGLHLHLRMQVTLCLVTSSSMYLKCIKIWKVTGFIFEKCYGKFGKMYPCEKTADKYAYVISWFMVKIDFWGISRSRSTHFINNRGKAGPLLLCPSQPQEQRFCCTPWADGWSGEQRNAQIKMEGLVTSPWEHPKFPTDAQSQTRLDLCSSKRDVGQRIRHETTKKGSGVSPRLHMSLTLLQD